MLVGRNLPSTLVVLAVTVSPWMGACGASDESPAIGDSTGGPSDDAGGAAGQAGAGHEASAGDSDVPSEDGAAPVIAETHGGIELPFLVNASGAGAQRVRAISVAANVGGHLFNGTAHQGFVYQSHEWSSSGYTLYDIISLPADGSDFAVTYLYCQQGGLPYVYSESFLQPMAWETASGSCEGLAEATETSVELPALRVKPQFLQTGLTIEADGLRLGATDGAVTLDSSDYELVPFGTVDCTTCPGGPWLEVHSMLFAPQRGCFGIVYLFPDEPSKVQLDHVVCLPGLEKKYAMYQGSWSGSMTPAVRRILPFRPRPPSRSWASRHSVW